MMDKSNNPIILSLPFSEDSTIYLWTCSTLVYQCQYWDLVICLVFVLMEDDNIPSDPLKTDAQNMLLNELCAEM